MYLRRRGMTSHHQQGRRCTECRGRFEPTRTAPWQKTCSEECRKRRRNRRARRRRREDVEVARFDERERQRQSRAERRGPPVVTCTYGQADPCTGLGAEGAAEGAVSQAGFGSEPMEIIGEIFEILDEQVRRSRTGLERQFRRLQATSAPKLEDGGRTRSPCHEPASGEKALRFSEDNRRRLGSDVTNREEPEAGVGQKGAYAHPSCDVHDERARGPRRGPRAPPAV